MVSRLPLRLITHLGAVALVAVVVRLIPVRFPLAHRGAFSNLGLPLTRDSKTPAAFGMTPTHPFGREGHTSKCGKDRAGPVE